MLSRFDRLRAWAARIKRELRALAIAARDPRTPRLARALVIAVVAYAASPIDLIPDPIPVLGYLDDLVLLPLGIALAVRMIPQEVLAEARDEAAGAAPVRGGRVVAVVIVVLWATLAATVATWLVD